MRAKQPKEKNEIEKKCENKNKTDKTNGEKQVAPATTHIVVHRTCQLAPN